MPTRRNKNKVPFEVKFAHILRWKGANKAAQDLIVAKRVAEITGCKPGDSPRFEAALEALEECTPLKPEQEQYLAGLHSDDD